VGEVGQERTPPALAGVQRDRHRVEGAAEGGKLAGPRCRHARLVPTMGDLLGGHGQGADRPDDLQG